MKKISTYIIIGLMSSIMSCNDFLEEVPLAEVSVDYIYTTADGLEVGVNALYNLQRSNNVPMGYSDGLMANLFFYVATDLGHTRAWHQPYGPNHTPAGIRPEKWTIPYQIIDRTNILISSAANVEMDEGDKNYILAQAKVIRAELYFDLIRMYDNILLDTIGTTPENAYDSLTYEVADPDDVYTLITEDLDFAIEHLSWTESSGRYGQGVARHLRGKTAMWQGDWDEAVEQFDAIIDNGIHSLQSSPEHVFSGDRNHSESLFTYQRDEILGGTSDTGDGLAGGGWHVLAGFFNNRTYELQSGEINHDLDLGGQSLGWSYPNDYLKSLYDQANDRRFETYYYSETLRVNNADFANFGEELPEASYDDDYRRYHWSLKKYHDDEKPIFSDRSYANIMYYRFAETLLLGAEAHWRLSGSDTDIKALEYINKIRERAFGNSAHNFTSFDLETYLEESARELAFEKNRWFLLKRLGLLVERQNMYYTYGSNDGNTVLEPMAPYMVRMPIPQAQIDLMGVFPQNSGY